MIEHRKPVYVEFPFSTLTEIFINNHLMELKNTFIDVDPRSLRRLINSDIPLNLECMTIISVQIFAYFIIVWQINFE